MPGTVLSTVHVVTNLTFRVTLQKSHYSLAHVTDEEMEDAK